MNSTLNRLIKATAVAGALSLAALTASASVITFGPGPYGSPVASTVEGNYVYSTFSGGLFRDSQGNGDAYNMEGCSSCGGGVLTVKRNDVVGGLFTFDQSDILYQFDGILAVDFEGFVGGVSQGVDSFNTALGSVYTTHAASALAGVNIDELRVTLRAAGSFATGIDNLTLSESRVPAPATLTLVGLSLVGLGLTRRRAR